MLTILFLLLHLARNLTWIKEKLTAPRYRKEFKNISLQPHDIKTLLTKTQPVNNRDSVSDSGLPELMTTLIGKFNAGIIDESGFRQEVSRLLIAAELSSIKKSA